MSFYDQDRFFAKDINNAREIISRPSYYNGCVKRYLAIKTLEGLKMKYDLVIENACVATIDKDNTILKNCSIAIKDSKICDIFSEKEELE